MATTSITISDEAYEFLKSIKGKKSFSETILSLKSSKDRMLNFAGTFREEDFENVETLREKGNSNAKNRTRY